MQNVWTGSCPRQTELHGCQLHNSPTRKKLVDSSLIPCLIQIVESTCKKKKGKLKPREFHILTDGGQSLTQWRNDSSAELHRAHTALGHSSVAKHGKRREWVMTSTPNEKLDFLWCNQSPYTASRLTLTNYNVTCTEPLVSSSRRVAPIHTIALNEWVLHKIISDQL